jgi:hypothetical protein
MTCFDVLWCASLEGSLDAGLDERFASLVRALLRDDRLNADASMDEEHFLGYLLAVRTEALPFLERICQYEVEEPEMRAELLLE